MMKKLSEYAPAIGIVSAALAAFIGMYAGYAVAEHNDSEKSHPALVQAIRDNKAEIKLVSQKLDLQQLRNDDAHESLEENQERMLNIMLQVQQTLANRN